MKKLCALLGAFFVLLQPVNASASTENWYVKQSPDGGRPAVMGGNTATVDRYDTLYLGDENEKTIYLTFDAGYVNENVISVLDTLKKHGVRATFFVLPAVADYNLEVAKRMVEDGHLIGNHSASHRNMGTLKDKAEVEKELSAAEEHFLGATGAEMSKFFRPPEGAFSEDLLKYCTELGYTTVFWSFAYADWDNGAQPNCEDAKEKILSTAHNGEIMLLHPNSATNAAILDEVITALEEEGYRFDTVDNIGVKSEE
ncbi:MAG: delta-lactam-biosynthetic de-N-acetylase [Ruminococcaceae bacterium]|nr:delta-lactam-biosynthetic de-N-acetylase [Oscillospiraceae bacterium]